MKRMKNYNKNLKKDMGYAVNNSCFYGSLRILRLPALILSGVNSTEKL
jgi:hypothetical protein